jgi:hypothetical protein
LPATFIHIAALRSIIKETRHGKSGRWDRIPDADVGSLRGSVENQRETGRDSRICYCIGCFPYLLLHLEGFFGDRYNKMFFCQHMHVSSFTICPREVL